MSIVYFDVFVPMILHNAVDIYSIIFLILSWDLTYIAVQFVDF